MSKQTAVEYLIQYMMNNQYFVGNDLADVFEQVKAMEYEQIIETWHNGYNNQSPMIDEENCGQQYYNETYKGGEQ